MNTRLMVVLALSILLLLMVAAPALADGPNHGPPPGWAREGTPPGWVNAGPSVEAAETTGGPGCEAPGFPGWNPGPPGWAQPKGPGRS
jgi:hypothetical protein